MTVPELANHKLFRQILLVQEQYASAEELEKSKVTTHVR